MVSAPIVIWVPVKITTSRKICWVYHVLFWSLVEDHGHPFSGVYSGVTVEEPESRVVCPESDHHVATGRDNDCGLHGRVLCIQHRAVIRGPGHTRACGIRTALQIRIRAAPETRIWILWRESHA